MTDSAPEPQQWDTLEEALAWLDTYTEPSEEIRWTSCYAAAAVYYAFQGKTTLEELAKHLNCSRREAAYVVATARDWPPGTDTEPETRYLDHPWTWHRTITQVAQEQKKKPAEIAELCLVHGNTFILAVSNMTGRLRRQAETEQGMTYAEAKQEFAFPKVWEEYKDKSFAEVFTAAADVCPLCEQRLPAFWWDNTDRFAKLGTWDEVVARIRQWWDAHTQA